MSTTNDQAVEEASIRNWRPWFMFVARNSAGRRWIGTFVVFLALGSAFTTAALMELGLAMLPLVDKTHLLVLLAFYSTAFTVIFQVTRTAFNAIRELVGITHRLLMLVVVWFRIRRRGKVRYRRFRRWISSDMLARIGGRYRWWYLGCTILIFILVGFLASFVGKRGNYAEFGQLSDVGNLRNFLIFGGVAIAGTAFAWFVNGTRSDVLSSSRYMLAAAAFLWLLAAIYGGLLWVQYLKEVAPRVLVSTVDNRLEAAPGSIAMPGTDGVILFLNGSGVPHFVPWSQLAVIQPAVPSTLMN